MKLCNYVPLKPNVGQRFILSITWYFWTIRC